MLGLELFSRPAKYLPFDVRDSLIKCFRDSESAREEEYFPSLTYVFFPDVDAAEVKIPPTLFFYYLL